ncbi:hypothetical protein C1H46_009980 [Malus baccata]|uniref:Uncharacterized protein n=1 Tax=Malus baccata TaxID=106549 RepID=A0A540MZX5_MALBA|nr:hypothetical protein C1H46_009980 [Malus baccata]
MAANKMGRQRDEVRTGYQEIVARQLQIPGIKAGPNTLESLSGSSPANCQDQNHGREVEMKEEKAAVGW